ncbi:MAG: hypothetical protein ACREHD_26050, partial [Pirellulales bacterium]
PGQGDKETRGQGEKEQLTAAISEASPPTVTVASPSGVKQSEVPPFNAVEVWGQVVDQLGDMLAEMARFVSTVAIPAPNRLVASFPEKYTSYKAYCERPENLSKLEQALANVTGQRVRIEFGLVPGEPASVVGSGPVKGLVTPQQRLLEKSEHPLVRRAAELFGAYPVRVEEPETTGA